MSTDTPGSVTDAPAAGRRFPPVWATVRHPVYHLETQRRVGNHALRLLQISYVPAVLGITGLALTLILAVAGVPGFMQVMSSWRAAMELATVLLALTLAVILLIQIAAGALTGILTIAQVSPLISGEIELQSWRLLRTTTLSLREILYSKLAAALSQVRGPLIGLLVLRVISTGTIVILLTSVLLREVFYYWDSGDWRDFWLEIRWLPPLIGGALALLVYLGQPLLQMLLNGAIGMLASVYARSRGQAIAAGLVGRLGLWVLSILLSGLSIYLLGFFIDQWSNPSYAAIEAFHRMPTPSDLEQIWALSLTVGGFALAVAASQLALALIMLGLMQRRAREIGA